MRNIVFTLLLASVATMQAQVIEVKEAKFLMAVSALAFSM